MSNELFLNGATWLRADFHLHTRVDSEFVYSGKEENFIYEYVKKLVAENIRVCVITNHNKFNCHEFKNLKKEAKKNGIYMLPGVELSLKDGAAGIHVLVVFDDEWIYNREDKDYIQDFLTLAFAGVPNYSSDPYPNSVFDLQDAYKKLDEFHKDYFFILAHVDAKNGFFNELRGRNLEKFIKSDAFREKVFALQKSRNRDNRSKIKIACVEGSGNAQMGIDGIGQGNIVHGVTQKTYIKLGAYNFEALKYALKDFTHRVSDSGETIQNAYIKSVKIEGGIFNNAVISFSSELNCLIGIRGSGKSSFLEIVRYTLGLELAESSADKKYKQDLIEFALGSGGKVVINFVDKHGEEYRIEKIYGKRADIFRESTNELLQCSIGSLVNNIIYYGQNDLSNKKQHFQIDLLDKIVSRNDEVKQQLTEKKYAVTDCIRQLQMIEGQLEQIPEVTQQIKDAKHKLEYFKKNGLEEKLKEEASFNSDETKILGVKDTLVQFSNEIENIYQNYKDTFSSQITGSLQNKEIFEKVNGLLANMQTEVNKVGEISHSVSRIVGEYQNIIEILQRKGEKQKEEFAKIKRDLNSETVNPDTFLNLTRFLEISTLKLEELNKLEAKKNTYLRELDEHLYNINNLILQDYNVLKEKAEEINRAGGSLRIEVKCEGNKTQFFDKICSTFKGSGIREAVYQKISTDFADFIEIYRNQEKLAEYLNGSALYEFKKRFHENLADLLTYEVGHSVNIYYNGKLLEKLSLGQRASALILFLLTQKDNDILIIDQPEDDLDNQVIYNEVIKTLLNLKGKMQFIFATHNPNIPVLGDSEKILAFNMGEGNIPKIEQGSIDTTDLQSEIVNIMEGGKDAFDRRKTIYNTWRIQ